MADVALTLGTFEFTDVAVPERLPFGGDQALSIHKLVGGARVVDALGRDDAPLSWSGRFQGPGSLDQARALDALRIAGQPLPLTWSELTYTVVIRSFTANYEADWQIPYSIVCEIVSDNGTPTVASQAPDLDDQMTSDLSDANDYADGIGDPTLSSNMSDLTTAVQGVPSFVGASQETLASVGVSLQVAQARVSVLLAANDAVTGSASSLGGLQAGAMPGDMAAALTAQTGAMNAQADLLPLQGILGRMATNLSADGVSGTPVVTAGGDLARIAAVTYGDAGAWPNIAKANGLSDPLLAGVQTIRVPPQTASPDGLYQP